MLSAIGSAASGFQIKLAVIFLVYIRCHVLTYLLSASSSLHHFPLLHPSQSPSLPPITPPAPPHHFPIVPRTSSRIIVANPTPSLVSLSVCTPTSLHPSPPQYCMFASYQGTKTSRTPMDRKKNRRSGFEEEHITKKPIAREQYLLAKKAKSNPGFKKAGSLAAP